MDLLRIVGTVIKNGSLVGYRILNLSALISKNYFKFYTVAEAMALAEKAKFVNAVYSPKGLVLVSEDITLLPRYDENLKLIQDSKPIIAAAVTGKSGGVLTHAYCIVNSDNTYQMHDVNAVVNNVGSFVNQPIDLVHIVITDKIEFDGFLNNTPRGGMLLTNTLEPTHKKVEREIVIEKAVPIPNIPAKPKKPVKLAEIKPKKKMYRGANGVPTIAGEITKDANKQTVLNGVTMTLADKMYCVQKALENGDRPFYAIMFANIDKKASYDVPTMAATSDTIYWNPDFVNKLTLGELTFVVMHEIMHITMMHHSRGRDKDRYIWNIATDLFINMTLCKEFGLDHKNPEKGVRLTAQVVLKPLDGGLFSHVIDVNKDTVEGIYNGIIAENPKLGALLKARYG